MFAASVHAQVLGSSFDRLPALLRGIHDTRARKEFSGRCSIESGRKWLARVVQLFASLPRRSDEDVAVHVVIERNERGETSESRYANAIDRAMPVLLNLSNNGQSWRENGISYERVVRRVESQIKSGCPALWEYLAAQLAEAKQRGIFGA